MKYTKITDAIHELTIAEGTEHAEIYLLRLFPGIILGINYVNIHRIAGNSEEASAMNALRINYCFEGRCEVKLIDGRYVYVDNNALCIEDHEPQYNFHYPLGFYYGIQLFIDKDIAKKQSLEALDLFGINLQGIVDKYSNSHQTFIQIASDAFIEKATEIRAVWESKALAPERKLQQIRFLLCYLLYYLISDEAINKDKTYRPSFLSLSQYMIALDCEQRITKDLSQKLTVERQIFITRDIAVVAK